MDPHDTRNPPPDDFTRGSFTMRRMTRGQVIALAIAALLFTLALLWIVA